MLLCERVEPDTEDMTAVVLDKNRCWEEKLWVSLFFFFVLLIGTAIRYDLWKLFVLYLFCSDEIKFVYCYEASHFFI